MKRTILGNIDKVFHVDNPLFHNDRFKLRYCNFIFEGCNPGDEFTEEELEEILNNNVKITIETISHQIK